MLLWWPLATCDALQPCIYGKKGILSNFYTASLASPPFLALKEMTCPGSKVLVPQWSLSSPFPHPVSSPELTFKEGVQWPTHAKDSSSSPWLFCGGLQSSAILLMNGCSKPELLEKSLPRSTSCLMHHQLNNWKDPFVPLCHAVRYELAGSCLLRY